MRLRYVALFALGLFGLWMSYRAPVPGMKMEPMKPDARVPTFQQSLANHGELERAQRNGQLAEQPKQHALRQAVLEAGHRVDASRCDEKARTALAQAIGDFVAYQLAVADKPPTEFLVVDGRTIDARGFLNGDATEVAREARSAGIVKSVPFMNSAQNAERFVCAQTAKAG
jgi:hypothetical protein